MMDEDTIAQLKSKAEQERKIKVLDDYLNSEPYRKKLEIRAKVFDACVTGRKDYRLSRGRVYELCKGLQEDGTYDRAEGCIFFIDNFGWSKADKIVVDKDKSKHLPFILFDIQREGIKWLIQCIDEGHDGFLEKSRDMGASWVYFVYVSLWYWLFVDGSNFLLGSYKEMLVDDKCYSEDTEVLTKDGWKFFKDVNIEEDLFATRNLETKEFQWQKATDNFKYDYDGDMYHFNSRSIDLLVSPNHRILHTKYWRKKEHISRAEDLYEYKGVTIPSTSNWTGKEISSISFKDTTMSGNDFCAFMGMYIAEGCAISKDKKYDAAKTRICISQQEKSKGFPLYKELIERIFGDGYGSYNGNTWTIRNKELYEYLKQFGYSYEKFIPEIIKNATPEQIDIFLYYYILGDGCWTSSMPCMTTVSKKLADDLQEIIQKIGKSSSISTVEPKDSIIRGREIKKENCRLAYCLRIRNSEYQQTSIDKVYYKGNIYCVSVPNEILYVRRNGKPAWSGNSIDSLFGKLEYALTSLPKWMMPPRFKIENDRTKMKLMRKDNGNQITGDTMHANFGRGPRKTAIFFDELGFWDEAKNAWESSGEATNCRFANSTPCGMNFYGLLRETGISKFTMHWKDNPFKDQEWYDYQCFRYSPEAVAQEIDISYSKSLEGKVYPDWNDVNVKKEQIDYDPNLPLYVSWDFGNTDDTAIIWAQPYQGRLRIIDTYSNHGKVIDFYIPFVNGIVDSGTHPYNPKDLEKIEKHKYWKAGVHFGDPAGRFKNSVVDKTVFDVLRNNGIHVNFKDEWKHFHIRKEKTRQLILNGIDLNMNSDVKYFDVCIMNAAYPKVKREGIEFTQSKLPRHDKTSHFRTSLEFMALGLDEKGVGRQKVIRDKFQPTKFTKRRAVGY